jgi:hypothetical protein
MIFELAPEINASAARAFGPCGSAHLIEMQRRVEEESDLKIKMTYFCGECTGKNLERD